MYATNAACWDGNPRAEVRTTRQGHGFWNFKPDKRLPFGPVYAVQVGAGVGFLHFCDLTSFLLFRFSVECFNSTGGSRVSEPILATVEDNEHFATVPLYGIILYSGPHDKIPSNFRKLDGTLPGVPNIYSSFNMKTDISQPATAASINAAKGVPWYGGLCYIQRIY